MKILIVLTSHGALGATDQPTGFWLEELAAPYYVFKDARADITLASPKGGRPPLDPKSETPAFQTEATRRFTSDRVATAALDNTVRLADISAADFGAVFYPGGHGPLWDLAEDRSSIRLIETMFAAKKPIGAVCHGVAALIHAKAVGEPLVRGKRVTAFSNSEEAAVGLTAVVPYLIEDVLKAKGGIYSSADDWASCVVAEGSLVTGQNPASSAETAKAVLSLVN